ncbi:MAG: bacteriohemerythrin [Spirochaetales bacterium]|nr:bacteriohemerythrin [Spirochaetales bacterium]
MVWDNDYSVGVKEIDEQHKQLFKLIERFKTAISDENLDIWEEMRRILIFLVKYASYHFEAEEALMQRIHYPQLDAHKVMHATLIGRLREVLERLKAQKSYKPIEFYYLLMNWLTDHILAEDSKIGNHYSAMGGERTPALRTASDLFALLEPPLRKLEMMQKNGVLSGQQKEEKQNSLITKLFQKIDVTLPQKLLLALQTIDLLLEEGLILAINAETLRKALMERTNLHQMMQAQVPSQSKHDLLHQLLHCGLVDQSDCDEAVAVIEAEH